MNSNESNPTISSPEQEARYTKVVFGHRFREFDRDQLITYYFAYKAGLVTLDTPVECTDEVAAKDLGDTRVLVIEGVPESVDRNSLESGNIDNDPNTDDPAAWVLQQKVRGQFPKEIQPKMQELANWFRARETGKQLKNPLQLISEGALGEITTNVLRGIKENSSGITSLLTQAIPLLESITSQGTSWTRSSEFELLKADGQRAEAHDVNTLREHLRNPENHEYTRTLTGKKLLLLNTTGTLTDSGIETVRRELIESNGYEEPDLIMIVSDTINDTGQSNGSRIILRSGPHTNYGQSVQELFEDRLNYLEALFGRGYKASFGGHPGFEGSDKIYGSGLDPRQLWFALQRFLDTERYSLAEFKSKATEFAEQMVGVPTVHYDHQLESRTVTSLPDRYFELTLRDTDNPLYLRKIKIFESDIVHYETVFNEICQGDTYKFNQILATQNDLQYPREIAEVKRKKALDVVMDYQQSSSSVGLLDAISELTHKDLIELPLDQELNLLQSIVSNEETIDAVWNIHNSTYRITSRAVPNHIASDSRLDARARFLYQSVSQLVDQELLQGSFNELERTFNKEQALSFASILEKILTSKSFKESHGNKDTEFNDRVLDVYFGLMLLVEKNDLLPSEVVTAQLNSILNRYNYYRNYLSTGASRYSRELANRIDGLISETHSGEETTTIPLRSNPGSRIEYRGDSVVEAMVDKQIGQGLEPIMSIKLELGRAIDMNALQTHGVARTSGISEPNIEFVSEIKIGSTIETGPTSGEPELIAESICHHMSRILEIAQTKNEDARIRMIASGLPADVQMKLIMKLAHAGIANKVLFGNYSMQNQYYYDMALQ